LLSKTHLPSLPEAISSWFISYSLTPMCHKTAPCYFSNRAIADSLPAHCAEERSPEFGGRCGTESGPPLLES
jgi:hypothetical protein